MAVDYDVVNRYDRVPANKCDRRRAVQHLHSSGLQAQLVPQLHLSRPQFWSLISTEEIIVNVR